MKPARGSATGGEKVELTISHSLRKSGGWSCKGMFVGWSHEEGVSHFLREGLPSFFQSSNERFVRLAQGETFPVRVVRTEFKSCTRNLASVCILHPGAKKDSALQRPQ